MDSDIAWEDCIQDLPLDTAALPPLNALSTSSSDDLPQLDLLDLFNFDPSTHPSQSPSKPALDPRLPPSLYPNLDLDDPAAHDKLSHCTDDRSPAPSTRPSSPPSDDRSESACPLPEKPANPQPDLVLELSTRLASAGAEATALRKRVASLAAENRGLRQALDHANARLVAVAQAASAHPGAPGAPPVVLGLAQVSSDVAHRLGNVLTVSSSDNSNSDDPRDRKKRKRMAGAATTMACVMFMWGAFVGTPGLLKGSGSYRSDGNLPAVWTSSSPSDTAVAPVLPSHNDHAREAWQPNCMRVLEQLPHGREGKEQVKEEPMITTTESSDGDDDNASNKMFVNMGDEKAANVVARADDTAAVVPDYSYVLCRDAASAIDNIKACRDRSQRGEPCGQPHTISLILPASAAGLEEDVNDTKTGGMSLAEVQCTIMSVARIPSNTATVTPKAPSAEYGKVIATVPEAKVHVATAHSAS